jgi:post-segregation antitoxin (ccd killing protein)
MNHNVYLPDEISERAKAAGLNLSGLLRIAVTDELDRLTALEQARDGMSPQNVDVDSGDESLRLRFTGKNIAGTDPDIYLTNDGKVVLVWDDGYDTFDDVDAFSDWVSAPHRRRLYRDSEEAVTRALAELGGRRVVDL